LLPAQTRYEQRGGGTETTTERRILFSPEIPGPRVGECRSEWETLAAMAQAARPDSAHLIRFEDAQAIREEIAQAVPAYDGIQRLGKRGDQIQWGGERLCEEQSSTGAIVPRFNMPDGRARFTLIEIEAPGADCKLRLSTRRGKQFNSMVQRDKDPLTGAVRGDVLLSKADADKRGLAEGDRVMIKSATGQMEARCRIAAIKPGNVQVHWPESNMLIARGERDRECGIPDFNTIVEIARLD
jgi:predicted molibdopterin-dependent oxidoreductase YjgC